jgi:hypothetical protein
MRKAGPKMKRLILECIGAILLACVAFMPAVIVVLVQGQM